MTAQPKLTYSLVKNRYEALRQVAREATHEGLPTVLINKRSMAIQKDTISLEGFTFKSQHELKKWELHGLRRVAWDWDVVQKKYKTHPKRFELSIWYRHQTLCAASIGRPTWGGGKLRLDFIESAPLETPLDGLITDITIAAGVDYALSIGTSQLRIMNPVNTEVQNYYLSKPGFSYDSRGDFCYRDLT
ncbi:MAG: hypothetical protein ACR2PX_18795 [Endozoicomonas sp.]|uniref:hypothetical protein n=1 Tax=Endozoicomonas sp. TaxID=1892382 RepID=UPI003D9B2CD0